MQQSSASGPPIGVFALSDHYLTLSASGWELVDVTFVGSLGRSHPLRCSTGTSQCQPHVTLQTATVEHVETDDGAGEHGKRAVSGGMLPSSRSRVRVYDRHWAVESARRASAKARRHRYVILLAARGWLSISSSTQLSALPRHCRTAQDAVSTYPV